MTADERLEALLNRAGQTISDMPEHKRIPMLAINRKIKEWKGELIDNPLDLYRFILHLTDIIDRMETALENVTGERDWLVRHAPDIEVECNLCVFRENTSQPPCDTCTLPPGPNYFEYAGIPGNWRADNEAD